MLSRNRKFHLEGTRRVGYFANQWSSHPSSDQQAREHICVWRFRWKKTDWCPPHIWSKQFCTLSPHLLFTHTYVQLVNGKRFSCGWSSILPLFQQQLLAVKAWLLYLGMGMQWCWMRKAFSQCLVAVGLCTSMMSSKSILNSKKSSRLGNTPMEWRNLFAVYLPSPLVWCVTLKQFDIFLLPSTALWYKYITTGIQSCGKSHLGVQMLSPISGHPFHWLSSFQRRGRSI